MSKFDFILLYVENAQASAKFYSDLLGKPVMDSLHSFEMVPLLEGIMPGLWQRDEVQPAPTAMGGSSEISVFVADKAALDIMAVECKAKGIKIVQEPTDVGLWTQLYSC